MARYAVNFTQTVSSTAATATQQIGLVTGAGRRCAVYDFLVGMQAAVVDAQIVSDVFAVSALTAGAAMTPVNLDQLGGAAPVTTASSTPTAVTTTGQSLLHIVFNSRATVRWVAVDPDSRIVVPSGGGAGGTLNTQNQQPGTVAGMSINQQIYFAE